MDVSEYKFDDDEIQRLHDHRDNQADVRLKLRFIALLMLAEKVELKTIASITGKSVKTIENWHHQYVTKGIESLNSFQYKPKKSYLTSEQIEQVVSWVKETNPGKTKEVKEYIKRLCREIPPAKRNKKNIEQYFEMKRTCNPGTVFLFGDGMHLVHQNVAGLCWGDPHDPPILKTNTGRKRLNILGAYNPNSHAFVHLSGEENCDAKRVIEYLDVILKAYHRAPAIVLTLDNAKYFKAEIVSNWLDDHPKLTLRFLPSYAPNLNLIERFWRFVKERLVKNTFYEKYKTFRAKVFQFLNHVDKYTAELETLMVEKFEIVKIKA